MPPHNHAEPLVAPNKIIASLNDLIDVQMELDRLAKDLYSLLAKLTHPLITVAVVRQIIFNANTKVIVHMIGQINGVILFLLFTLCVIIVLCVCVRVFINQK